MVVHSCPVCKHEDVSFDVSKTTVKVENQTVIHTVGVCDNCGCAYHYDTEYLKQQSV